MHEATLVSEYDKKFVDGSTQARTDFMIQSVNKPHFEPPVSGVVHILERQPELIEQTKQWVLSQGHQPASHRSIDSFLEALLADQSERPACVVLDFTFGENSGIELIARFKREKSLLPFVFVASSPSVRLAVAAMEQGAVTVIERPCDQAQFEEAISDALSRNALSRRLARRMEELRQRFENLSQREQLVMQLVVEGRLNKAIARELKMTERTVERVRAVLLEKVGADSAVQMASMLTEHRVLGELLCRSCPSRSNDFATAH
jgi:FixJ family two-component response regulator